MTGTVGEIHRRPVMSAVPIYSPACSFRLKIAIFPLQIPLFILGIAGIRWEIRLAVRPGRVWPSDALMGESKKELAARLSCLPKAAVL